MAILLALMMATIPALADDPPSAPAPVGVTTNYLTAHWSFRRVDGKLYNIEKSVLWREIKGRSTKGLTNGMIVRTFVERSETYRNPGPDAGTSISNLLGGRSAMPTVRTRKWEEEGPEIFLLNYDDPGLTMGQPFRTKAIKVGTYNYEGAVIEKWDCGTPNVVPVVVTNLPATQTNVGHKAPEPPAAK